MPLRGLWRFCDLDLQFLILMLIKLLFLPLCLDAWHARNGCVRACLSCTTNGRRILTYFGYNSVASLIWIHEAIFIRYFYFFCFGLAIFSFVRSFPLPVPTRASAFAFFRLQHNALCLQKRGSCLRMQYLCPMWMEYLVGWYSGAKIKCAFNTSARCKYTVQFAASLLVSFLYYCCDAT